MVYPINALHSLEVGMRESYARGGLEERPRGRPEASGISGELRRKIVKLRKRYEWGSNKIEGYLRHRGFSVPHNGIYRIICEEGLNNPITKSKDLAKEGV